MAICGKCGKELPDNIRFCTVCGSEVTNNASVNGAIPTEPIPTRGELPFTPTVNPIPNASPGGFSSPGGEAFMKGGKYEPISTLGYIGIILLMAIPIVGFILTIIWALGGCRKVNKRNFARAALIIMIIGIVISLIGGLVFKSKIKNIRNNGGGFYEEFGEEFSEEFNDKSGGIWNLAKTVMDKEESTGGEGLFGGGKTKLPNGLPKYPGGTAVQVEDYRTEISDTTLEDMLSYIETLKGEGFKYEDLLEFGFSEEDMLAMNGWWATDGKLYISISYNEGKVILDCLDERPTMEMLMEQYT